MIKLKDLDQSHDWDSASYGGVDPHNPEYLCRKCRIQICPMCHPEANTDYAEAMLPCPERPWWSSSV